MRRLLAILVAMVFSWMLIVPAFSTPAASNLPACCRNNGKHHCQMKPSAGFASIGEKCPYLPHAATFSTIITFNAGKSQAIFAGFVSHPANAAQTEAGYRVSHARAKQKRGPPSFLS